MADRLSIKGMNGVSYGCIVTASAQDATDSKISGTFAGGTEKGLPYPLAFSIQVINASNVIVDLADAKITLNSPLNGDFIIEDGAATFAVTATDVVHIIAQPAREV